MTREDFKISNQARVSRTMSDRGAVQGPWSMDHYYFLGRDPSHCPWIGRSRWGSGDNSIAIM